MTAPPALRPLGADDPARLAEAFAAIGWDRPAALFEGYLAEQRAGERLAWVAADGERPAGYVTLHWRSPYPPFRAEGIPEIRDLNVLPGFRRRGIASALLDVAEAAAGRRSRTVGIGVGLEAGYGAAQRLYVRRGYVPDGRGVAYRGRTVRYGERVPVDDDLVLWFTRSLAG